MSKHIYIDYTIDQSTNEMFLDKLTDELTSEMFGFRECTLIFEDVDHIAESVLFMSMNDDYQILKNEDYINKIYLPHGMVIVGFKSVDDVDVQIDIE